MFPAIVSQAIGPAQASTQSTLTGSHPAGSQASPRADILGFGNKSLTRLLDLGFELSPDTAASRWTPGSEAVETGGATLSPPGAKGLRGSTSRGCSTGTVKETLFCTELNAEQAWRKARSSATCRGSSSSSYRLLIHVSWMRQSVCLLLQRGVQPFPQHCPCPVTTS